MCVGVLEREGQPSPSRNFVIRRGPDQVPSLLRGVQAGLLMLARPQAVQVVEAIGSRVSEFLQPNSPRHSQRLDRLADAIVSLAGKRTSWDDIGRVNRLRARDFTWDRTGEKLEEMYGNILKDAE